MFFFPAAGAMASRDSPEKGYAVKRLLLQDAVPHLDSHTEELLTSVWQFERHGNSL